MLRRVFVAGIALVAVLAAVLAGIAAWVIYTESGLRWSLARIGTATHGAVTIERASGTWAGGMSAQTIEYRAQGLSANAHDVELVLSPWSVLRLAPRIETLNARRVVVRMEPGDDEPAGPPDSLALPIDIDIASARAAELIVHRAGAQHRLQDLSLSYAGGRDGHAMRQFHATHEFAAVDLTGTVGARSPFPLAVQVSASLQGPVPAAVHARLTGSVLEMTVDGKAGDDTTQGEIHAVVTPFAAVPLQSAQVNVADLDLRRYFEALPPTRIAAELAVRAEDGAWTGPLRITNSLHGPWDRQRLPLAALRAEVALRAAAADFHALQADLGLAGVVSGSATVRQGSADLRLATNRLDLRGLQSKLRATHLAGRADMKIAEERQSASGVLEQDDIRLAFDARREGDDVQVRRFSAQSRGSELRGEARLSLAGQRPYAASAVLGKFDPSAWGDFPHGALNGRLKVAGALDADEIRVQYELDGSRLLGSTLDGAGRLTYARERISDADLRLALAGNTVIAKGAFGRAGDRLGLRITAPRLAALNMDVSGAVNGSAQLTGTWQSPRGTADLRARRFAYGEHVRLESLALNAELRSLEERAFRVHARAHGITTPAWNGKRMELAAEGTEAAHTMKAHVEGRDLDLDLQARGGWFGDRWSGVVSKLENAGDIPFRLGSPVDLTAGKNIVRVGPFAATVMDGRLDVARLHYENGDITSEGRFSNFPVRPLMALAGMPAGPRDTLRLTGDWSVAHAPGMIVDFAVRRESGDLVLGRDRPLALGLETLRMQGRLVNDRLRVDAGIRSALVSGDASATIATVKGSSGAPQITARSPVEFSASAEVARLAAFAGLFDTTTVYLDGRVDTKLSGRGTVGDPVISGTIEGERLTVALPPEGIDLTGGTLRARLTDNRIEVQRFAIRGGEGLLTAQGTLSLDEGQRAALDWRADRLMILGRPDRRLVVTGSGNASFDRGKLAVNGKVRANEGLFQFGQSGLPTLGPDVIVLGRPKPTPDDNRLAKNTSLHLAIDLGDNLHVIGHGLDAWIEGTVVLRTAPSGTLLAEGTLSTQRGRYTAFGQRLQVDRGRLLFNGPIDNPGLDVRAMRKNQAVEAGVAITGTVNSPVVRVVSDPAVPEGEALSWLVLGRAPGDASRGDLAMLPLAAAALFGQGQSGKDTFASKLGLDTLSLRGSTTLANNVVAVGKRFSRNLYVVYEQSLGGIANVLKVELNLTRRFLLRAEAGEVSAAGLFFRYAFD